MPPLLPNTRALLEPPYLKQRAVYRRSVSPNGIGAAAEQDLTEPGRDGRVFSVVITDTIHGFARVEVHAPRVPRHVEVEPETIEEFVEAEAGEFPLATRMRDLCAASPLRIELFLSNAA